MQLMQLFKEIKQRGYSSGGRTSAFDPLHAYANRVPQLKTLSLPGIF
ncbi:MAG TPA: hypothetical protein VNS32_07990 [Flavisolibacter sp.]|nr:hypothetical protein [Flavisolibacter sp.]